jgi:hypothetical protein
LGADGGAIHAAAHPLYRERYQHTKRRLGRQRGAKVVQLDLARKLTEAIWYMLATNPSLRQAPLFVWLPDSPSWKCATGASPMTPILDGDEAIER